MRDFSCIVLSYPVLSFQVCRYSSLLRVMEGMNVAMASGWMRSLKLNDAADMCIAHGIDGFVLLALLDEEGGLESIGVISAVDKAKVRGGIRKMTMEVGSTKRINAVEMEADKKESVIEVQPKVCKVGGWWGPISLSFYPSLVITLRSFSSVFVSLVFVFCLLSPCNQDGCNQDGLSPLNNELR